MKVQVGIGINDAWIQMISLIIGRKSRTIRYLYGVATV